MCVMNVTPSLRGRQGMLEQEDMDICFAGGNRQENELMKVGRKMIGALKRLLKI